MTRTRTALSSLRLRAGFALRISSPAFDCGLASTRSTMTLTPVGQSWPCKPSSFAPSCKSLIKTSSRWPAGLPASSTNCSAAVVKARPSCVPIQPGAVAANRCRASAARWSGAPRRPIRETDQRARLAVKRHDGNLIAGRGFFQIAVGDGARLVPNAFAPHAGAGVHEQNGLAAFVRRRQAARLSLVKNGRAKPVASNSRHRQRSSSSHGCSSLRRRVTRGGVGRKNISELKGIRFARRPADEMKDDRRRPPPARRAKTMARENSWRRRRTEFRRRMNLPRRWRLSENQTAPVPAAGR